MKVWVVLHEHPDEARTFHAVFATPEAAERERVELCGNVPDGLGAYHVEEHEARA